jgi:hypothetical protein
MTTVFVNESLPPTFIGDGTRERPFRSVRQAIYGSFSQGLSGPIEVVHVARDKCAA